MTISDAVVVEGNLGETLATFTVALSKSSAQQVSLAVALQNGSATTQDNDYFALPAGTTIVFAPGQTTQTLEVRVRGDRKFEADETFSVVLSAPQGVVIGDGTGVGTIQNDDADIPVVFVADARMREGHSGTTVVRTTIQLSKPSMTQITVFYRTLDGTATVADADYIAVSDRTPLVFAAGQTSRTVDIQVVGDRAFEPDETFFVELQDATNAVVGAAAATIMIENDDRNPAMFPTVHLTPTVVIETSGPRAVAEFVISLTGEFRAPVWLEYRTGDGTARAGSDYTAVSGKLKVLPGEREKKIWVTVAGDMVREADEFFTLTVTPGVADDVLVSNLAAGAAGLPTSQVRAYIIDDDSRFFTVRPVSTSVYEGDAASFVVDLARFAGFGGAMPATDMFVGLSPEGVARLSRNIRFEAFFAAANSLPFGAGSRPGSPPSREAMSGKIEFGNVTARDGTTSTVLSRQFDILTAQAPRSGSARSSSRTVMFQVYGSSQSRKPVATSSVRVLSIATTAMPSVASTPGRAR